MNGDDRMRFEDADGTHGSHPHFGGTPAPERVSASSDASPFFAALGFNCL